MAKTLDPIVVNEKKELETPTFFKKDIEQIAKEVCTPRFDLFNLPKDGELYGGDDIDECIAQGKLPANAETETTTEQFDALKLIFAKYIKQGYVYCYGYYCILNYFSSDPAGAYIACFGCTSNQGGQITGSHYEITLHDDSITAVFTEL